MSPTKDALDAPCALAIPVADQLALLEDLFSRGREIALEVTGGCMRPWISAGDEVVVGPCPDRLRVGQVALVRLGERGLIHRVVRVYPDGRVQTRGDRNLAPDPVVSRSDVLGLAVRVNREGGGSFAVDRGLVTQLGRLSAPGVRLLDRLWRPLRARWRSRHPGVEPAQSGPPEGG